MITEFEFGGKHLLFNLTRHSDFSAFYQVAISKSYPNLFSAINQGDIVIDGGANIGIFTIMAGVLAGDTGKVIAIEPDPENLRILRENIKLNKLKNVIIVNKALYSKSGKLLKLYQNGVLSRILTGKQEVSDLRVESITLDDILKKINLYPTVLKMDIEGAEKFALIGMKRTMRMIEYFEAEIHSKEDYRALMKYSKLFAFSNEPVEDLSNVIKFTLKHPLKILKLEYNNKFLTTKRVLQSFYKKEGFQQFPKIIYGRKLQKKLNKVGK